MMLINEHNSKKKLSAYGVVVTKEYVALNRQDAAAYAAKLGYPVVMKIFSDDIIHKTDAGGVVVNIHTPDDVLRAYDKIMSSVSRQSPHAKIKGIIVEEQASGHELIIGSKKDSHFGPVLMVGLGGIFVEVLKDVSFRVIPITKRDADEMIHELKAFKVLEGVRGKPKANISKLRSALLSVSKLVDENPDITELDINPLIVDEKRAVAADARIIVS